MSERRVYSVVLALIVALGAWLRLVDLAGPSLWLDEILHLRVTRSLADEPWYRHLVGVREIKGGTENGALYYRLQILGQRLAPGEVGVRLFPAVVGILTLPLMALAGRLLGGRLVALAATFLLAVSPLHVYFSREGRPYYLLMALALLLLYALLQNGSRIGVWVAWVGCVLLAYAGIHSIPILLSFAALSGLALILGCWRGRGDALRRSPFLHYLAAAVLALALAYGLYMTRSEINAPVLEKPEKQVVFQKSPVVQSPLSGRSLEQFLASMTTSGHPSVLTVERSWVLIALAAVGLIAAARRRPGDLLATVGMFLLPAMLSIAALLAVGRWYGIRYTSPALPAFLLLAALGIKALAELAARRVPQSGRTWVRWVAAGVLLSAFGLPNVQAARADPQRKLDWRGVARFFDQLALEGEPVVVPNAWPEICLDHYLRQLGREVEFHSVWESAARGEAAVAERPMGWLLTAGFRRSNEVRAWMHGFDSVLKKSEEEMDLFFFPDFPTFLETRYAAGRGELFEARFAAMGQRFDFADGEALLQGQGWSFPEQGEAGISFQWALGKRAELGLPIGRPRDARLRLRALPFVYPEAPPQRLELWLGDARLANLELPARWSEHQVEVSAAAWSAGANILSLRFAHSAQPADVVPGSGDGRDLSVAFDYLELN